MDERMALGTRWKAARPVPSPAQLAWQRDELAMFLHFGVNTFTDREWGDGTENPASSRPRARREAMGAGGEGGGFAC
jgi:alpha-L-fucosidase